MSSVMEFHDLLHGHIKITDTNLLPLLRDLLASPEVQRLRNMRQMNFDVPLIQELGRSRRLPHSIGVLNIAIKLAHRGALGTDASKTLMAAALLHDAAIPPYGHLVESEFKASSPNFNHENSVKSLVYGLMTKRNIHQEIVPGKQLAMSQILNRHSVDPEAVLNLICPSKGKTSSISADIDIDNIDNIHRMAAMLGWQDAKENLQTLLDRVKLHGLDRLVFDKSAIKNIELWLDFRQKIYTLIIAHPQCIPHNALQSDLVRLAIKNDLIKPERWFLTEPEFEDSLRNSESTRNLANQLISGCEYQLIDYVWIKEFKVGTKIFNSKLISELEQKIEISQSDTGYFVWYEKGLIARETRWASDSNRDELSGFNSTSCMIALVKKTQGKQRFTKTWLKDWRKATVELFRSYADADHLVVHYPEDYTGDYMAAGTDGFNFEI